MAASAAGEVVWEIAFEADDCRAPAIDGGRAVLGVTVGGVGRLQVRSLANGALLGERTLPGTCGADPGRLESGGSHWGVGAGDQVVLLDVSGDTPAVLQAADAGFLVEAVIALGSGGFVAAGGETLRVFTVADGTGGTALVAGSPIAAPGTLLSDPLAAPDCDPVASGGSHWWCPGGLVVAGGDGWLAAWALDGTVRYAQSTEDSVTGLALGDDGRVYSGGSHWLTGEGGWSLVAWSGPSGAPESLAGGATPAGVCVASPLVDTDGRVILDIGPDGPAVIPALAGGLAPGWARSGGSNTGAGTPADPGAPCPGGAVHLFSRPVVLDGLFSALSVAALPGGAAVMGGALSPEPFATGVPILVAIDAAGRRQWVLDLDDGDPSHPTVLNTVEVAGGALALMRGIPDGVTAGTRVVRVTADGQVAWDRFEGQVPNAWVRDAVELESGNIAVMGAYAPAEPTGDTWILLLDAAGGVLDSVPFDADGPVEIVTGTALPGDAGVVIGGLSGTDAYVGSWTLAGAADWQDIVPGTAARVVDVIPLSGGRTLAIGRDGDAAFTRIYSAGGALLGSSTLTGAFHPVAVRRSTTGRLVAFGDQFEVMLLSEGGAAGPIVAHAPGEPVQYGAAAASLAGGALLMVGQIAEVDFSVARGLALRIEPFGHAGCAAAGACVAVPGLDCGDSDPCTLDGCDPATGACTHAPLPDGAPCGDGTVCVAGACQSP